MLFALLTPVPATLSAFHPTEANPMPGAAPDPPVAAPPYAFQCELPPCSFSTTILLCYLSSTTLLPPRSSQNTYKPYYTRAAPKG